MSKKAVPVHHHLIVPALIAGLTLAGLVAIRFAWSPSGSDRPHYHADFALYVNGVRFDFDKPAYYEEVTACSQSERNNPATRAHLHYPDPGIVHVHDQAVTWSHFLANLGIVLADDYLATSTNKYIPDNQKKLRFILNGDPVSFPSAKVIGNEDVLLIDYGDDPDADIQSRYLAIEAGAPAANTENDPYGCFGTGEELTTGQRLWRALQVWR